MNICTVSVESCDSKCYGCADVVQMGSDEDTSKRSCNLISISHEKCFCPITIRVIVFFVVIPLVSPRDTDVIYIEQYP